MADPHDHEAIPADPIRFKEAVDAFLSRVPMTDAEYGDLEDEEKDFAFTVANVAQADLVAEVYESIAGAIEKGTTLEDFKADVSEQLTEAWGGEEPARLDMIFRTSVMDSYNAGRYSVMTAPATKEARPFWRYDGIDGDGRTCEICEPCIGTILPADHEWWLTHYPILHPKCRDIASAISQDEAEDEGITVSPPSGPPAAPGFGTPPSTGAGSDWEPDPSAYPEGIGSELEDKLAEAG